MSKKGLIRPTVNTNPIEPASPVTLDGDKTPSVIREEVTESKKQPPRSAKKFKNQGSQIKLSDGLKEEFNALKQIRKIKFDYDMLGILIDYYVKDLSTSEKRKFKTLIDD
ncbi:hypothetical protein ABE902_15480 [Enterococcus casseliflavus]|uniref:hypothetical protein n=1 Tax=Enterococcus casseliflavus TaxID=37734 RepID=UPI00115E6A57